MLSGAGGTRLARDWRARRRAGHTAFEWAYRISLIRVEMDFLGNFIWGALQDCICVYYCESTYRLCVWEIRELMVGHGRRQLRGFTVVELMVVIAVLVILLGILVPSLVGAKERGRTAK